MPPVADERGRRGSRQLFFFRFSLSLDFLFPDFFSLPFTSFFILFHARVLYVADNPYWITAKHRPADLALQSVDRAGPAVGQRD